MADATHGSGGVGWVAEPVARGTASLVFNCLSTTLICTWSALHLPVPRLDSSTSSLLLRKLRFLGFALLVPELLTTWAFHDWMKARMVSEKMRKHEACYKWSQSLSFFVVMRGVEFTTRALPPIQHRLDPESAHKCFRHGSDHTITAKEVEDKSKANGFNKAIAALQIMWFLTQFVGRVATRLHITPLEYFTLAYVICALAAYGFWWHAPFGVQVPLLIKPPESFFDTPQINLYQDSGLTRTMHSLQEREGFHTLLAFILTSTLFGASHLLAWNAHFPTPHESLLWRIGSICCITAPIIYCLGCQLESVDGRLFIGVGSVIYSVARGFLLFEAFFSLRSPSPDVYKTVPWAQYIPHI